MTQIILTPTELFTAANAGIVRQIQNMKKNRKPGYGIADDQHWQVHVEGALGECALAKYLGVYWAGVGKLRGEDVTGHDVRTRSEHWHDLILHESDPDDRRFWLLTGSYGVYQVHGSILARDGKRPEFWKDPAGKRAAYFIPQSVLVTLESFYDRHH